MINNDKDSIGNDNFMVNTINYNFASHVNLIYEHDELMALLLLINLI